MPKKAPTAKSKSAKKDTPVSQNGDDSFIIFANDSKDKPGKGKSAPKPQSNGSNAQEKAGAQAPAEEAVKKPDTRTLIGGSSWTGKLPVNLLSEHCQKQKWQKPDYSMSKSADGYSSMVVLRSTNPKTKETMSLEPFKLPPDMKHLAVESTAVEARHFAATYALFRVCSMRNIHMMLPPKYRDMWKNEFQKLKEADVKEGKGFKYEADPFLAQIEKQDAQKAAAKRREQKAKQMSDLNKGMPGLSLSSNASGEGPSHPSGQAERQALSKSKAFAKAPKVDMGKKLRNQIEELIRAHAIWNLHNDALSQNEKRSVVSELTNLGFRQSHVEEAVAECKDKEECLEWLLVYVPEDDLPKWSLPEGYTFGISFASGDLKREAMIKRLASAGYSAELSEATLDHHRGDEAKAAESLQHVLVPLGEIKNLDLNQTNCEDGNIWETEASNLEAIFGPRFTSLSKGRYEIRLEVRQSRHKISLQLQKSITNPYPHVPPIMSVVSEPPLPAHVRLSIIKRAILHTQQELLGDQLVFSLIDFLEEQIPHVIENPGKLREVAAAASSLAELNSSAQQVQGRTKPRRLPRPLRLHPGSPTSVQMLSKWKEKQNSQSQQQMLLGRQKLPAWSLKDSIVSTVRSHQVTIISGETGSGKSTQSVQFILDDMIQELLGEATNIVCTQPRRISALGLADRVSDERCGVVGQEVGYSIRGESKHTPGTTKISFVTTGVLLRRLQTSGGSTEDVVASLADVSHIVVDEVHERSMDTDFLLVLLRDVLQKRKDLKLVLMSATLDADIFETYFGGRQQVGKVHIPGRTYPVEDFYLDDVLGHTGFGGNGRAAAFDIESDDNGDTNGVSKVIQSLGMGINYELIASTVRFIDETLGREDGAVLIFLPGTAEISRTLDSLRSLPNIHALPLHASLLPAEQRRVFPRPPKGMRKVIAATNVAETSITIEDIVAVIDTGRVKETSYDAQTNIVKLEEVWASRAACKQRRGRAGRVREGQCYKLYTHNAEMAKMAERPEPEMRRVPLEQLCLSVRAMGVTDVRDFLSKALTPPDTAAVDGALKLLNRMGALDGDHLTALGRHLSIIPADLRCAKLLVYGATFGCLEACLTIASILTARSPFNSPQNKRQEAKAARSRFLQGEGDLLADLIAFNEWDSMRMSQRQRATRTWCDENFLSFQTLNDISSNRVQYTSTLKETSIIPSTYGVVRASGTAALNSQNENLPLIRSLIAAAFNPQFARIEFPSKKYASSASGAVELDPEARTIKYFLPDTPSDQVTGRAENHETQQPRNNRVFVHPGSTLFDAQSFPADSAYMAYFTKMATSKVFIRDLTPFSPYALLLFGGPITVDPLGRGLVVDDTVRLRGWARVGVLVSRLRAMLDGVLARRIENPNAATEDNSTEEKIVGVVRKLVELNGMDR